LFRVDYKEEGIVLMCARSLETDILIIQTRNGKYGITPKHEEEFIIKLQEKITKYSEERGNDVLL
jgi:hypothetical protein